MTAPMRYPSTVDTVTEVHLDLGTAALSACAQELKLTVSDVLRAAVAVVLHRCSAQDDLVLGTPAGPVRSRVDQRPTFAALAADLASAQPQGTLDPALDLTVRLTDKESRAALTGQVVTGQPDLLRAALASLPGLLADACRRPRTPVHQLALLNDSERARLVQAARGPERAFDATVGVHELVRRQALRTPDAVAVECQGRRLSYAELTTAADQLAQALQDNGCRPGDRVGISVSRDEHLVCLLLAVLQADCAYVPLDPAYPADRLASMARTGDVVAVVHDRAGTPSWLGGATALRWESLQRQARDARTTDDDGTTACGVDPAQASHLIFTSGSTGIPKGVVVSHSNVHALLVWARETYSPADVERVLFGTSLNFDLSVFELWCPLTTGGCILVCDTVLALTDDPDLRPSLVNTVPSALAVLIQRGAVPDSVSVLNVAGEALPRELVVAALDGAPGRRVHNLYGPSEDTTYSTGRCFTSPPNGAPTIGVPIHNTQAYLLDGDLQLVPDGAVGELCLGGAGLASGYAGDSARTEAAFVTAPASSGIVGRLYRTGDLARRTADGELAFLGRLDAQVKVRGYRIELGEIETVARQAAGVREVAAVVVRQGGDPRIVCYLTPATGPATEELIERCTAQFASRLPAYMQPSRVLVQDRLPLLPNGKVDRRTLTEQPVRWQDTVAGGPEPAGPLAGDEADVAAVWTDLLGLPDIQPDLDFFSVGGHSLLANLLSARLSELAGAPVRVSQVYEHRTVAAQADLVRRRRVSDDGPAARGEDQVQAVLRTLRESAGGHGVPGAAVAVYADGRLELAYHGYDDLASGRPRTAASRQRMTCVTKVLVAYTALMLVDRGQLTLDDPLEGPAPQAFQRRDGSTVQVTLRQLLSHTSGIDDSYEVWHDTDLPDLATYVRGFADYCQLAEPGEVFAYSACATSIVALLVEQVLGMPWRRAVNELLLQPLGIHPVPETNDPGSHYGDDVATGHLKAALAQHHDPYHPGPQTIADDATSSFAVCLTLAEVAAIARFALDDGVAPDGTRLLSADLARQMRTPQVDIPGHHFMHAWGLGWLMFGPTSFGFNSNGSGHHNFIQVFPEDGSFLVLLANAYPTFGLYEDLLATLTGDRLIRTGRAVGWQLEHCVGRYESDGYRLDVHPGPERLGYRYSERLSDGGWEQRDEGDLVSSGAGGFSSMSPRNVLAGSISFVAPDGGPVPRFVRMGQRVARRTS